jgi:SAM-dependent methyltransferase
MHLPPLAQWARLPRFVSEFRRYRAQAAREGARAPSWRDWRPRLEDATAATGFDAQYLYHCAWAARELAARKPERHVDFSSALWFVGIASAIIPIEHYDYRPPALDLSGVRVSACDLLRLPFEDGALDSVSCMHVVEHIGLGRYGDAIDALGDRKAMAELARVLAPGGVLLFAVPVGRPRVVFNSHRIYAYEEIVAAFPALSVERFSLITDGRHGSRFVPDADPALVAEQKYGCGCWVFRKPSGPQS